MINRVFSGNVLDKKKLSEIWKKNDRKTVVYLDNPFCVTKESCKYCMHSRCPASNHKPEEAFEYYFNYMPKLLKANEDIINNQNIVLVDFGGGTPNYLKAEDFDKYCSLLPKKILEARKVIELHPALITEDFIKVLHKHNFTTLTFCFQTFDCNILLQQGRMIPNYNNVEKCINLAKSYGMMIASDLITYWTTEPGWENVLLKDLKRLTKFDPDEVTISVLYQNKYNRDDFNGLSVYRKIRKVVKQVIPNYINPENTLETDFDVAATRLYKPNVDRTDFEIYLNSLSDIPWEHEQGYSTLGFGTYKNGDKAVYSMVGPDILYYEEFKGFDSLPVYHLHREWNFWDACRELIIKLEKDIGDNPPVGESLVLTNLCSSANINPFEHHIAGKFPKWKFVPRNCLTGRSEIEKEKESQFHEIAQGEIDELQQEERSC